MIPQQLARIYTPLHEAMARLECCVGGSPGLALPDGIAPARYAIFPNQIATPSHEVTRFLSMAASCNLTPLFFEFHTDKFVTRNRCKLALARMSFEDAEPLKEAVNSLTIIDIQKSQGLSFNSVYTLWGEPFVSFHHRLLLAEFPSLTSDSFFDGSTWFRTHGPAAREYYHSFLSLFISGCVLFETYSLKPDELAFTRDVVLPAFDSVCAAYGRPPLIVRLAPTDSEQHDFWSSYATSIRDGVSNCFSPDHLSPASADREEHAVTFNTKPLIRLIILCGGISPEHEVSLKSAESVFNGARDHFSVSLCKICTDGTIEVFDCLSVEFFSVRNAPLTAGRSCVDVTRLSEILTGIPCVAFSVIHGVFGEDGALQGVLGTLNVPYVGSSILASAAAMDKDITKRLLREAGIRVIDSVTMRRSEAATSSYRDIALKLGGRVFVKPANGGSSIGVSRVDDEDSFGCAIKEAFRFDDKILIERRTSGRELECCVIGNGEFHASRVGEIIPRVPFYSYEAKYRDPDGADFAIPAILAPEIETKVRDIAIAVAKTLGCQGLARVDFFLENDSDIFVNEVATMPEFTVDSMCSRLWQASGLPYTALIQRLVELAVANHLQVNRLTYVFEK